MNILFGAAGAMVIAAAAVTMRERGLQALYGAFALMTLAWLLLTMQQAPGHTFVPLLLLGVTLSGTVRGAASRVLALPIALLLPLTLVAHRGGQLAVHDPWRAAALVCMGAGIGLSLRYAWSLSERSAWASVRAGTLSVWLIAVTGLVVAMATPLHGTRAWNLLLPMVSESGQTARVVALHETSSRAWPWLEPLNYALPIALIAALVVIAALWFFRPQMRGVHPLALALTIAVMCVFGGVMMVTPGAWAPLTNIDAQAVVEAIRPPFVPHDAVTYLSPEESTWSLSRAALALWLGVGGWLGASALLGGAQRQDSSDVTPEHAALAPVFLLVGALFFAESWSAQAIEVSAQRGTQGLVFALAAFAGAAVLLRGRLRVVLCVLVGASSALWLAATLAQKVLA